MNKLSLAVNAVLLIAVGVLFYLYMSLSNKLVGTQTSGDENSGNEPKIVLDPNKLTNAKIAYINIDSLDAKYDYIIEKSKDIKNKQASLEAQYSSMVMKFQEDYEALQQAAQAGIRPEAELVKEQARLEQKQYEIANKEKQMQALAQSVAESQGDMLKNVSKFIAKFSNGKYDFVLAYTSNIGSVLYAKPDLEITSEVVKGLNEEYAETKSANVTPVKK